MRTIEAVERTSGSRASVWKLLADASTWAQWGSWSKVEVEGGGEQGPGALRVLHRAPFRTRERITDWVHQERMGYEVIEGLRVRDYRSTVTLEDAPGGGTVIRWRSTYGDAGPFTALLIRLAVRDACKRLAKPRLRRAPESAFAAVVSAPLDVALAAFLTCARPGRCSGFDGRGDTARILYKGQMLLGPVRAEIGRSAYCAAKHACHAVLDGARATSRCHRIGRGGGDGIHGVVFGCPSAAAVTRRRGRRAHHPDTIV